MDSYTLNTYGANVIVGNLIDETEINMIGVKFW